MSIFRVVQSLRSRMSGRVANWDDNPIAIAAYRITVRYGDEFDVQGQQATAVVPRGYTAVQVPCHDHRVVVCFPIDPRDYGKYSGHRTRRDLEREEAIWDDDRVRTFADVDGNGLWREVPVKEGLDELLDMDALMKLVGR